VTDSKIIEGPGRTAARKITFTGTNRAIPAAQLWIHDRASPEQMGQGGRQDFRYNASEVARRRGFRVAAGRMFPKATWTAVSSDASTPEIPDIRRARPV